MQKIVIDTNVIVSSLIQKNYPYFIVYELFLENKFELCISEKLIDEYYDVLTRPKFKKFPDFFNCAEKILTNIELKAKKFSPTITLELISDNSDNMILELAEECSADFIITGNITDFTFPTYKQTKILTPKEYWDKYKPD